MDHSTIRTELLIIGTGAAGLRSAISAHDSGARDILLLGKCRYGDAHTNLATGGINAALATMDSEDTWRIHAADTLMEGWFLADYRDVEYLCKNAAGAVLELAKWGARFHREKDGQLTQRFFGAHTYRRTCFYGDQTGKEMMRVLLKETRRRKIRNIDDVYVFSLLKKGDRITGALGIDFKRGKKIVFEANAVILAAGGYTKIYSRSSSRSFENHGDGAALAFEAGVDLVDMEMVQFHPTGMLWPKAAVGVLVTEAVRGEGGILLNSRNKRFMRRYDPLKMELGPRDLVARAIYSEVQKGNGTEHGGVWLDITMLPKSKIMDRLPKMYNQFKKYEKVDITRQRMEVAPTAHYTMGGVDVSLNGETKVRGLFAVGETVGQIHGANRLGGNSLLETVVFGKMVGAEAARFIKRNHIVENDQRQVGMRLSYIDSLSGEGGVRRAEEIRGRLQSTMWDYAGIVRDERRLRAGLKRILALRKEMSKLKAGSGITNNIGLKTILETTYMTWICEAVLKSAIMRKESRGAHYRSDYPKSNDRRWMINIISRNHGGRVELYTRNVRRASPDLLKTVKSLKRAEHKLLE